LSVDAESYQYPEWSPFNYCKNNPIIIKDLDGRSTSKGWYEGEDKEIVWNDNIKSQEDLDCAGIKGKYLGDNVLVGTHCRDENGNEQINSAQFDIYLMSNKEGPSATICGNTVPGDINQYGTLKEGLYKCQYTLYKGNGALLLNDGNALPTTNGNPNNDANYNSDGTMKPIDEQIMDHVLFHPGNTYRESLIMLTGDLISEGCQTGESGKGSLEKYKSFINYAKKMKGLYYLRSQR
jgi:hypothetical protein